MNNITVLLLLLLPSSLFSQLIPPTIQWQKCFGGFGSDHANCIIQTSDGGYVVAGQTQSNDGNVSGYHGVGDYWIVKVDSIGSIDWQKCLGGTNTDAANSIQQTFDGGYIISGSSGSNDGDVSGNNGASDYWIVKLDSIGNVQWQKSLGGTANDIANSIQQTNDSGYIVVGSSVSNDGDVTINHGDNDYWVVKLDQIGNIQWEKSFGGSQTDQAKSVTQTIDGGFIVAGHSISQDGNVTGNNGGSDFWIVKLDNFGSIQWEKSLGGTLNSLNSDVATSIKQTADGGYIVGGYCGSNGGDITGYHVSVGFGDGDYWIVKLDSTGNIQWQKCFGGTSNDQSNSIQLTHDGGYVIAGFTASNDGDVTGNHGGTDYWIVKLNSNGIMQWQKCLGGTGDDVALSIEETTDNGYIIAGETFSYDGDVTGWFNHYDYWIVKLSPDTTVGIEEIKKINFSITPSIATDCIYIDWQKNKNLNGTYNIFDTQGRLCKTGLINNNKISVSDLSAQFYFIQLVTLDGLGVRKFIKE